MKLHHLCAALLALALVSLVPVAASAEPAVLSASGFGECTADPDEAIVTISVVNHARDAHAAQQENARRASLLRSALNELGISSQDIKTQNYSFYPTYKQNQGQEIDGYTVNNRVTVRIDNIKMTGEVIDRALKNGANQIDSLDFSLKEPEKLREKALRLAIRDARAKATVIAGELGERIIGEKSVNEDSGSLTRTESYANGRMMAKAMADAATPVEPGTVSVSARIHIDFLLSGSP